MTIDSPEPASSFIYTSDFSKEDLQQLLLRAAEIKAHFATQRTFPQSLRGRQVALFFAEASTRTKISFQMAIQRMGGQCLVVDGGASSSMSKGETITDTFWTIHAMKPDAIVVRCGEQGRLDELAQQTRIPIINAGFGHLAHPTQALLDAMTICEQRQSLNGQRVLFVGDIRHSRVANSNFHLLKLLGAEIGICGPPEFLPDEVGEYTTFTKLDEALGWATIYCGLRVQFERHGQEQKLSETNFISQFSLTAARLQTLPSATLIMHPGPVNWGIEFQQEVAQDPRLLIWQQKENGVYVRAALLEKINGRSA